MVVPVKKLIRVALGKICVGCTGGKVGREDGNGTALGGMAVGGIAVGRAEVGKGAAPGGTVVGGMDVGA